MLHSKNKIIISSCIGNALEWFEYMLYAYFADIIGQLFFPSSDHRISTMMSFGVFAVGFISRLFGAVIFGIIGDRFGRKISLSLTIILMAVPTGCIGLLPTYNTIGILAPILLIILRLIQGISLGGEFSASSIYLIESAPIGEKNFFGSLSVASTGLGFVTSILLISVIEHYISHEYLISFGWRIPFFICFLFGLIGLYIRKNLSDTEEFLQTEHNKSPISEIFKNYKKSLITSIIVFSGSVLSLYILCVSMKSLMVKFWNYSYHDAFVVNIITMLTYSITSVISGIIADKFIDKKLIICFVSIGIILITPSLINTVSTSNVLNAHIIIIFILIGILIGMYQGVVPAFITENFPANVRSSGVALVYNISALIFGGTAPLISIWIIGTLKCTSCISYYIIAICAIASITSAILYRKNISNLESIRK